jgi:predicted dienelactone hydrolase
VKARVRVVLLALSCATPDAFSSDAGEADAGRQADGGMVDAGGLDAGGLDAGLDDGAEVRDVPVNVPMDFSAAPSCSAGADAGCLYRSATYGAVVMSVYLDDVTYVDAIGHTRVVPMAVYRAPSAPQPAPVVLLSHGGSTGKTSPQNALANWAELLAARGYLVVAMAHDDYTGADYDGLCAAADVPVVSGFRCGLKINWARPWDVAAVLSWLQTQVAVNPRWSRTADLSRLAHLGHSAGAGAALMIGGVTRDFRCAQPFGMGQGTLVPCDVTDLVSRRLPDVKAIVALSPEGPGSDGFMDESFPSLAVPMLMATGLDDGDPGEPANRLLVFDRVPAGDRWKVYLDEPGAKHGLFEGNLAPCEAADTAARCSELRAWLTASISAFLDAQLRSSAHARQWLDSTQLQTLSGGTATLTAK